MIKAHNRLLHLHVRMYVHVCVHMCVCVRARVRRQKDAQYLCAHTYVAIFTGLVIIGSKYNKSWHNLPKLLEDPSTSLHLALKLQKSYIQNTRHLPGQLVTAWAHLAFCSRAWQLYPTTLWQPSGSLHIHSLPHTSGQVGPEDKAVMACQLWFPHPTLTVHWVSGILSTPQSAKIQCHCNQVWGGVSASFCEIHVSKAILSLFRWSKWCCLGLATATLMWFSCPFPWMT